MDRMREQYGKGYKDGKEELRAKVDKAIHEMKMKTLDFNIPLEQSSIIDDCIKILERNIGE